MQAEKLMLSCLLKNVFDLLLPNYRLAKVTDSSIWNWRSAAFSADSLQFY
jgi:hypothetical protein